MWFTLLLAGDPESGWIVINEDDWHYATKAIQCLMVEALKWALSLELEKKVR